MKLEPGVSSTVTNLSRRIDVSPPKTDPVDYAKLPTLFGTRCTISRQYGKVYFSTRDYAVLEVLRTIADKSSIAYEGALTVDGHAIVIAAESVRQLLTEIRDWTAVLSSIDKALKDQATI